MSFLKKVGYDVSRGTYETSGVCIC